MGILAIIAIVLLLIVLLFDIMPYCLATIMIGRFPPGGPYVWQIAKSIFQSKRKNATWDDI